MPDPSAVDRKSSVIAIAAVPAGEFNDVGSQPLLVLSSRRNAALRRTVLPEHTAYSSFGQFQLRSNMTDADYSCTFRQFLEWPLEIGCHIAIGGLPMTTLAQASEAEKNKGRDRLRAT